MLLAFIVGWPAAAQSIADMEASIKQKPDNVKIRESLANAYARDNKPDRVIALLNPYTDQLDSTGFLLLASSYSSIKDYPNEARVLGLLSARDNDNYKWHMLLGQAYLKHAAAMAPGTAAQAELTAGIKQLRQVLILEKKYKPAFDLLLNTFLQQKSNNEARELLTEGIEKFGRRPEFFRELCRLDSTDGFLVQAIKSCRTSIKLSPGYPDHYVYLAQTLHDQDKDVEAERDIVTAAKRFAKNEFVQWAAGTLFLRRKNYSVSARYFQAALAADPASARAHFGLAQALFESGSEAAAFEHFVAACKAGVGDIEIFFSAGSRLKQKGNSDLGNKYTRAANTCRTH